MNLSTLEAPARAPTAAAVAGLPASAPSPSAVSAATATGWLMKGLELQNAGRLDEAEPLFLQVLALLPNHPAALYSQGVVLLRRPDATKALPFLADAVQRVPGFAPLWGLYATALQAAGRNEDALAAFDRGLEQDPNHVEMLLNSGVLLRQMLRHHAALERFNRVLTVQPQHASAMGNLAILLTEFKQHQQAVAMFERLLAVKPDHDYGLGLLVYERMHACDWTDWEAQRERIVQGVREGRRVCKSLPFMALSDDAADHQSAARIFASHWCPPAPEPLWQGERYRHDRIRLAYLSADLREHPVAHLTAGIFERHDRRRFETIALSLGPDDGSRLRQRMQRSFDRFIDVHRMGSAAIAKLVRDLEVDILVDLGGYTSDARTDVLARRPAPVQVNWLGYPGTMGVPYMDYILADRHVIPPAHQRHYDEGVVYLPDTYLPTDGGLRIAERTPTRAECGLPDEGFVFCSFNHDYKIAPPMFRLWMRLLTQVPGSVLWLMSRGDTSQRNLRAAAAQAGIAPERLVFAKRVPRVEDHLARYRQADLFLDTHPYNAHTTCADALMAGLPVLTCSGGAFPSRVAGSLLHAAGLPELVTGDQAGYEALALRAATDRDWLRGLRERLAAGRVHSPLFDTDGFTRHLEAAFVSMWRARQLGDARDALTR